MVKIKWQNQTNLVNDDKYDGSDKTNSPVLQMTKSMTEIIKSC